MKTIRPETTAAWTNLITVSRRLLEGVEAALKEQDLPPLSWYDALWEIEKAGSEGIRPFELKDRLLLPQYGTSRLLERMVKTGLIRRETCEGDGRGQSIVLTDEGKAMRQRMWPVYARFLEETVQASMRPEELQELAQTLNRLGTKA